MSLKTTFERREIKYVISGEQYEALRQMLVGHTVLDRYGISEVSSIYYDTPDRLLIRRSIEKPMYKEKLRLRCYGSVTGDSSAFVELKKKFDHVVYKRRVIMPLGKAMDYLAGGSPPDDGQIAREIDYALRLYGNLQPSMAIFYRRMAFIGKEDKSLRITFDSNVLWREDDLDLTHGAYGKRVLDEDKFVMEIKCSGAMPLWLTAALDKVRAYPTGFSKYGTAYKQTLMMEEETYA